MNRGVRVWYKQKNRWLKQDEYKINPDGSIATYEVYTTKWQLIREDSTGLHDKNGKEIYEGDRIRILYSDWVSKSDSDPRTLEQYKKDISDKGIVFYEESEARFLIQIDSSLIGDFWHGQHGEMEVIGNIHESPEVVN